MGGGTRLNRPRAQNIHLFFIFTAFAELAVRCAIKWTTVKINWTILKINRRLLFAVDKEQNLQCNTHNTHTPSRPFFDFLPVARAFSFHFVSLVSVVWLAIFRFHDLVRQFRFIFRLMGLKVATVIIQCEAEYMFVCER